MKTVETSENTRKASMDCPSEAPNTSTMNKVMNEVNIQRASHQNACPVKNIIAFFSSARPLRYERRSVVAAGFFSGAPGSLIRAIVMSMRPKGTRAAMLNTKFLWVSHMAVPRI